MRKLSYAEALNEALHQIMETRREVVLIGQGVKSPWYVGTTTVGLIQAFGERRVVDTPVSENAVTGIAVGAALKGLRPILEHPRMDFMYLALDQIANHAANWHFMFGGHLSVPLTIWGIVNRGGEQAAQHSQALHALFAHIPGLKVVAPSTPYDVKGLLLSSVEDDNPVLFVDDRWLYPQEGEVPEELYRVPLGRGEVRRAGSDVTVIASSFLVHAALDAADTASPDADVEVLDLRSLKPLDRDLILASVKKTGRAVVVDGGWKTCGMSAEIAALLAESGFSSLQAPVMRVALPDTPAPASAVLEKAYYPGMDEIVSAVREVIS